VPTATPPPLDSYRYVLRRTDWDPTMEWDLVGYDETARALPIVWRGELGVTAFCRTVELRDRHTKLGWIDVTDEFRATAYGAEPQPVASQRTERARATRHAAGA